MITLNNQNRSSHEVTRDVASTSTPSKSQSASSSMSSASLQTFESELATLVNDALQAAGISPSQATFSFAPASASTSTATPATPTSTSAATTATTPSVPAASNAPATTNIPSPATTTQTVADTPAPSTTPATTTSTSSSAASVVLSPASDPVVGTEGLVYNPSMESFGGMGAAPITSTTMWKDPFSGQSYSADLILAGYQKIYGNDYNNMVGALVGRWGESAYQSALQLDPTLTAVDANPNAGNPKSLFEQYGAYGSFVDPKTGVTSYFDANGQEYATGSGPAMGMFNALGQMTGAAENNPVAV